MLSSLGQPSGCQRLSRCQVGGGLAPPTHNIQGGFGYVKENALYLDLAMPIGRCQPASSLWGATVDATANANRATANANTNWATANLSSSDKCTQSRKKQRTLYLSSLFPLITCITDYAVFLVFLWIYWGFDNFCKRTRDFARLASFKQKKQQLRNSSFFEKISPPPRTWTDYANTL